MRIFNFFGSKENKTQQPELPWRPLTSMEQLDEISTASTSKPVAIFKHSTRCGISRMVLRQFESGYDIPAEKMDLYYLDLLAFRDISDEVGYRFQVLHQSPQLIVVKGNTAVYNASHHQISPNALHHFV